MDGSVMGPSVMGPALLPSEPLLAPLESEEPGVVSVEQVPEPSAIVLGGVAMAAVGFFRGRKRLLGTLSRRHQGK